MPLWLALVAHFWIPGERITPVKAAGQGLAFFGLAIAIIWRSVFAMRSSGAFVGVLLGGDRFGGADRPEGRRAGPAVSLARNCPGADPYDSGTVFYTPYQVFTSDPFVGAGVPDRGDCDFWLYTLTLALVALGLSARKRRCIQFPVAGFRRIFRLAGFG